MIQDPEHGLRQLISDLDVLVLEQIGAGAVEPVLYEGVPVLSRYSMAISE